MIKELKERLKNSIVEFTYTKKDGSTRTAKGTTQQNIITEDGGNLPKGTGMEISDSVTRYYDLNSNGWRSFTNDNLVSIDN
jgi:hypothetical protein